MHFVLVIYYIVSSIINLFINTIISLNKKYNIYPNLDFLQFHKYFTTVRDYNFKIKEFMENKLRFFEKNIYFKEKDNLIIYLLFIYIY